MMLLITNVLGDIQSYPEMHAATGNGSDAPALIIPDMATPIFFKQVRVMYCLPTCVEMTYSVLPMLMER